MSVPTRGILHSFLVAAALACAAVPLAGADGDFDTAFGFGTGFVTWNGGGSVEVADAVALADGTLIGVGTYDSPSAAPVLHWQGFSRTGNLLTAKSCYVPPGTLLPLSSGSSGLTAILDSTGALLVGGWARFPVTSAQQVPILARFSLTSAGCVLDTTFSGNGWLVVGSPDGIYCTDASDCRVVDLAEIRPATGAVAAPRIVALLESVVLGGTYYHLAAFTSSGTLDTAFGAAGFANLNDGSIGDLFGVRFAVDGQGRLEVAKSEVASSRWQAVALRFTADGDPDLTFGVAGRLDLHALSSVYNRVGSGITALANGRTLLSGENWDPVPTPASLPYGTLYLPAPLATGAGNVLRADLAGASGGVPIVAQGDGKAIAVVNSTWVAGPTVLEESRVLRVGTSDLSIDAAFANAGERVIDFDFGGANGETVSSVLLAAGRVVLAGTADETSTTTTGFLVRLRNAYLFADGFEWGTTANWSSP